MGRALCAYVRRRGRRLLGFDALSLRITGCDASADADDARDVEVPYGDRVSASDAAAYLVTGTADGTDGSAAWTGADATFRVPRPNEIALVAGAVQAVRALFGRSRRTSRMLNVVSVRTGV